MKDKIIYISTIIFSIIYIFVGNRVVLKGEKFFDDNEASRLILSEIQEVVSKEELDYGEIDITFKTKILEGENKGEIVEALQIIDPTSSINYLDLKKGDKIYLYKYETEDEVIWYADQYDRASGLIVLGVIFALFILLFGRKKGVNTIVALIFTCLSVFVVYIPAIIKGKNIYFWSIITCLYIGVSTLLIVQGATKKSFAAMIRLLNRYCYFRYINHNND